jgi:hypothetical protein
MHDKFKDRVTRQVKEIYGIAGIKAEEYSKIGRKRLDILSLGRDKSKEIRALGERVHELARREDPGSIVEDVTVKAILSRLEKIEDQHRACSEEIEKIREAARERAAEVQARVAAVGDRGAGEAEAAAPEEVPEATAEGEERASGETEGGAAGEELRTERKEP